MLNVVFYFQVHQPYRLRHLNVMDIGSDESYFDERLNREVMRKVADKCYLPTNKLMLKLIKKYEGKFKIAYSISGITIDQFKQYYPEVLESFKELAATGCVEFLGETYYHSLSFLYNKDEFLAQVEKHTNLMIQEFGQKPTTFRNTELIYQDRVSDLVFDTGQFNTIITEGVRRVLKWRTPLFAYKNYSRTMNLLLKSYQLSDDIAFRFSDKNWSQYPLTSEKFIKWIDQLTWKNDDNKNQFLNLFMDYETFGEHQWAETGIFDFMEKLPEEVLKHQGLGFANPKDANKLANYQQEPLAFPQAVSWADEERDLSAWLENDMQNNAIETLYELFERVLAKGDPELIEITRKLTTSDHFYYMCTKYFNDGDVHKYFSPYDSPDQAYIYFINALADLEERL
ncbi:glycoside hydrolase family 57 protein [bacterium]|nr:glycoside hydrolase family 57 protein [bacterium]